MARGKGKNSGAAHQKKRPIERYEHSGKKRVNNPPVGLVTPETDPPLPTHKTYDYVEPVPTVKPGKDLDYDPHLDPQLVWAGKKEHASFEVPTVSLHVHETIDPRTIIEAVRKRNGNGVPVQPSLFERPEERLPLHDAIDFYKHAHGWSNRLIAGDSLLVMNSLLEKEGMAGQVQMVYIDPPYGIKYGSNFQPFVNKRDVKDGKDEDLTQEPEMIRAFRDTWELGIHSYLTYLRDRLLLARELLHESGSCFVQISDENLHHVRELLDDVFGHINFVSVIHYTTAGGFTSATLSRAGDFLLWYAKNVERIKYRRIFQTKRSPIGQTDSKYDQVELPGKIRRALSIEEKSGEEQLPDGARIFRYDTLVSAGFREKTTVEFEFDGKKYHPGPANNWKASVPDGMNRLAISGRIAATSRGKLVYVRYFDDFPAVSLTSMWSDVGGTVQSRSDPKVFVVQTGTSVMSALHEKLVTQWQSSQAADSFREGAKFWRARADDLTKTNSATAKYFENAKEDDLVGIWLGLHTQQHSVEQIEKYRDDTLVGGCGAIEAMNKFTHILEGGRAKLSPEVVQALDVVELDEAALATDCSSERAKKLLGTQGKQSSDK
jgi:adenine-specific DNA-methyltransferase